MAGTPIEKPEMKSLCWSDMYDILSDIYVILLRFALCEDKQYILSIQQRSFCLELLREWNKMHARDIVNSTPPVLSTIAFYLLCANSNDDSCTPNSCTASDSTASTQIILSRSLTSLLPQLPQS